MIAEELINQMIPPLKMSDSIQKALQWMEELRVHQLPVIENKEYKGLISEEIIYQHNLQDAIISELSLIYSATFVYAHQHFYDILRLANQNQLQLVSVLNEENYFIGAVTLNDTLMALSESASMQEAGGILVFWMDKRDYSLSEISRLVESNDAKILSTYLTDDKENPQKIKITIKLNTTDLNRIIATFERFSYHIIGKFQDTSHQNIEQERLDHLFKFLSI
ncbi:MAG: CBS domain-containing protein [Bacteroidetes bacterium]|nr:MAG: CBS domain-containing protein [Bacteroidota bacterium]TAG89095.1 MAG: CBS domain-containing protein [Bacteroidota bacterium]